LQTWRPPAPVVASGPYEELEECLQWPFGIWGLEDEPEGPGPEDPDEPEAPGDAPEELGVPEEPEDPELDELGVLEDGLVVVELLVVACATAAAPPTTTPDTARAATACLNRIFTYSPPPQSGAFVS